MPPSKVSRGLLWEKSWHPFLTPEMEQGKGAALPKKNLLLLNCISSSPSALRREF